MAANSANLCLIIVCIVHQLYSKHEDVNIRDYKGEINNLVRAVSLIPGSLNVADLGGFGR